MFDKVKSGSDAILFYWFGHNMVNARLKLDDSADPFAPKIQFPPESICQDCRNVDSLSEGDIILAKPGYDVLPVRWNKLRILNFLRNHFGPDNIRRTNKNYTLINEDLYDPSVEFVTSMHVKRR
uniref:Sulfhydryl oxidase 1 (Trinotate prediction) n=1 Tax=Myxobolus squamalis TaxID=59785 RepID=A0A6B2G149_MYXSQ